MKKRNLFPFNLQFFAEGGGEDASGTPGAEGGDNSGNGSEDGEPAGGGDNGSNQKIFTQDQVTAMMAKEKRQGKNAIIKELGFKSESEAKQAIKLLNALLDSQKSTEDKAKENEGKARDKEEEALRRAEAAENKVACLMAGVGSDSVDDVLAIALLKVTEENGLDKVLEGMKKEKKYASFFGGSLPGESGTGSTPGHSNGGGNNGGAAGDYGKRLAQSTSVPAKKKSSFFMED